MGDDPLKSARAEFFQEQGLGEVVEIAHVRDSEQSSDGQDLLQVHLHEL
jgi:hypothetical protein